MSWNTVPLNKVVNLESGFGFPREYQGDENQTFPFFRVSDMNIAGNEVFMENHSNTVSAATLKELGAKAFPAGTVIFPKIGAAIATEKKRILTKPATYDNNVMGAVPKAHVNAKFLYYWFLQLKLTEQANPGHVPSIRKSVMEEIPFPVVTPSEQSRIVELLDQADCLRRLRREADAKAARILHALFLEMFGDMVTNPMGWPTKPLSDIAMVSWGNTSLTKGSYTTSGFTAFSASGPDGHLPFFEHDENGIVLSAIGARCGKCFLATGKWTAIKNTITVVRPALGVHILFLMQILDGEDTWPKRGGGQPFIALGDARSRQIPQPPSDLQERFGELATEIRDQLRLIEIASDRVDSLFALLLERAFAGQLTAQWREGHMKELMAEMFQQARALNLPTPRELEALS
jgi:type I restriction enzyme S subunit